MIILSDESIKEFCIETQPDDWRFFILNFEKYTVKPKAGMKIIESLIQDIRNLYSFDCVWNSELTLETKFHPKIFKIV